MQALSLNGKSISYSWTPFTKDGTPYISHLEAEGK